MKIIKTSCRICNCSMEMELEEGVHQMFSDGFIKSAIVCTPCHEFARERARLSFIIERTLRAWQIARTPPAAPDLQNMRESYRKIVTSATQNYAILMAKFHGHKENVWSPTMVDELMVNPEKFLAVLAEIRKKARAHSTKVGST